MGCINELLRWDVLMSWGSGGFDSEFPSHGIYCVTFILTP